MSDLKILISFYDWCKDYMQIQDGENTRSLTEEELESVKEFQEMTDKGYKLVTFNLRRGMKMEWIKTKQD